METLSSSIDSSSSDFQKNSNHHQGLANELRQRLARVREGGGEKYRKRQEEQGKLFVRDRIERLLDPNSPFLEFSRLGGWEMYESQARGGSPAAPGGGIVPRLGRVSQCQVFVLRNGGTGKGGSDFPDAVRKHLRRQQIGQGKPLPCLVL